MQIPASIPALKTVVSDPSAAINRLVEQPPQNLGAAIAVAVFCLLAGVVVVTDTGERFSLDR